MTAAEWFVAVSGWTLLHSVWQVAIIYLVSQLLRQIIPSQYIQRRYATGVAALLAILLCLLITAVHESTLLVDQGTHTALRDSAAVAPTGIVSRSSVALIPDDYGRMRVPPEPEPTAIDTIAVGLDGWIPYVVTAWAAGFVTLSASHVLGLFAIRRLVAGSNPVEETSAARWSDLAAGLGIGRAVRFLVSRDAVTPLTVGWLKPAVLVPIHLATRFSVAEIDAMIAHELAHVRRYDFLINQFQVLLESLLYYHPCFWLLSTRIRRDRELCCDALAIDSGGDRRSLGQALIRLAELRTVPSWRLITAANGGSLVERVAAIAQRGRGPQAPLPSRLAVLGLATLFFGCLGAGLRDRAAYVSDIQYMAHTHESVFVQSLLPRVDGNGDVAALIAALAAAQEQAAPSDSRFAEYVENAAHGFEPDFIWNAYLAAMRPGVYPTVRREYPEDWPYTSSGTHRRLARLLWKRASELEAGELRRRTAIAALRTASMRRETTGMPAVVAIVLDPRFQEYTGLSTAAVYRLRHFAGVSNDAAMASWKAIGSLYAQLQSRDLEEHALTESIDKAFTAGERYDEIGYIVPYLIRNAPEGPVRDFAADCLLKTHGNDVVVRREAAALLSKTAGADTRPAIIDAALAGSDASSRGVVAP